MNQTISLQRNLVRWPSWSKISTVLIFVLVTILIVVGWQNRNEYYLTAESGLGYALGIIGGVMMLLLLIYPLRKRFNKNKYLIFSTKKWFQIHMALGVFGPLLVLYHSNFRLGSSNSAIALASMILMVSSGLVGRFIYSKTHHGLYGKKIQLKGLQENNVLTQSMLDEDAGQSGILIDPEITAQLSKLADSVTRQKGVIHRLYELVSLKIRTRATYFKLIRNLVKYQQGRNPAFVCLDSGQQREHLSPVEEHIEEYLATIRRISSLSFYERLFSLWHMLHLPIFFMLIVTGFVHVYAVHVY